MNLKGPVFSSNFGSVCCKSFSAGAEGRLFLSSRRHSLTLLHIMTRTLVTLVRVRKNDVNKQNGKSLSAANVDGNTSSCIITEVKHLELNQFSDG